MSIDRPLFVALGQLEARLTEERAELVASNGLLDQNERLRAAIVAEEREKFQSEKVRQPCQKAFTSTLRIDQLGCFNFDRPCGASS